MEKFNVDTFLNNIIAIEIPMTKTCNLRCRYCYIRDVRYKQIKVTAEDVIRLYEPIRAMFPNMLKPGIKCHIIPWGSEPLCEWETIQTALTFLFNQYPDVPVTTHWSTNATAIIDEYVEFVRTYWERIESLQISLDGPQEVHDYSRVSANGQGSFLKVMAHIRHMENAIPGFLSKVTFKSTIAPEQIKMGHVYKASLFFWEELNWSTSPVTLVKDQWYDQEAIKALDADLHKCREYCEKHPGKSMGFFYLFRRNEGGICSAGQTEVCVDLDGEIYICHTSATDDSKKQYFRLGNVLKGELDTKGVYRNLYCKYNYTFIQSALCKAVKCPIHHVNPNICWNCPMDMHNLSNFPYITNISFCEVMRTLYRHYLTWGKDCNA